MKYEKYLTIESKEKDALRANNKLANEIRDAYYGVGDHIGGLVTALNSFNGETGLFGNDLKNAKKALEYFNKMNLGKYV
jgi:hypothetical protein